MIIAINNNNDNKNSFITCQLHLKNIVKLRTFDS